MLLKLCLYCYLQCDLSFNPKFELCFLFLFELACRNCMGYTICLVTDHISREQMLIIFQMNHIKMGISEIHIYILVHLAWSLVW